MEKLFPQIWNKLIELKSTYEWPGIHDIQKARQGWSCAQCAAPKVLSSARVSGTSWDCPSFAETGKTLGQVV